MKKLMNVVAVMAMLAAVVFVASFSLAQETMVVRVDVRNEPIDGQDFFVFDVVVAFQDSYPVCTITVDFDEGSDQVSNLMPTTSIRYQRYGLYTPGSLDDHPADPAWVFLSCEGSSTVYIRSNGNTLPYQGEVRKVVESQSTNTPTLVPTNTPTLVPTNTATLLPTATATNTLVPSATPCYKGNSGNTRTDGRCPGGNK